MHPTTGTVYVSQSHPDMRLLIDSVTAPEADGFFLVEVVELDDGDDTAPSVELTGDEWAAMVNNLKLTAAT